MGLAAHVSLGFFTDFLGTHTASQACHRNSLKAALVRLENPSGWEVSFRATGPAIFYINDIRNRYRIPYILSNDVKLATSLVGNPRNVNKAGSLPGLT